MKTADDVTEEIWANLKDRPGFGLDSSDSDIRTEMKLEIAQSLTAFRDEALEEAAKICENPKGLVSRDYIRYAQSTVAPEIRALKDKP